MGEQSYTDKNGVQWTIITAQTGVFATPDPRSQRKYDDAPDLGPIAPLSKGDAPGAAELASMRKVIEAYAGQHAKEVALEVRASRDGGAWVWLLLVVLILAESEA